MERINGAPVLCLRDRLLPVVPLAGALGLDAPVADDGFVVVAEVGRRRFGILVNAVFHTEEIVVKPMSAKLRSIPLFAGNTILGDGTVVLIVDPNGVAATVSAETRRSDGNATAAGTAARYLVFRSGNDLRAVPLSLVTRLETVAAERIEWLGENPVLQYRGRLMRLVPAEAGMAVRRAGSQDLLVFSAGERPTGLLVDGIVDIVCEEVEVTSRRPGILGTLVLRGRATDLVDVGHVLSLSDGTSPLPTTSGPRPDPIALAA